jgi:hypothetical protein
MRCQRGDGGNIWCHRGGWVGRWGMGGSVGDGGGMWCHGGGWVGGGKGGTCCVIGVGGWAGDVFVLRGGGGQDDPSCKVNSSTLQAGCCHQHKVGQTN